MLTAKILVGDVRERLREVADGSIRTCVTSPPYWGLRDYGHDGQLGLEQTPHDYVARMVEVFREVRRVLADDGTLWLNLGDSYASQTKSDNRTPAQRSARSTLGPKRNGLSGDNAAHVAVSYGTRHFSSGLKNKDLVGIPWRVAFALQADGWYLRQDIIWAKPNPMPESVTDRCTKAHEYVFLLTKSPRYYYDNDAVSEEYADATVKRGKSIRQVSADGTVTIRGNGEPVEGRRNRRSVWTVATKPFRGAHFAVMPETLVEPCVLAGSAPGDTVLDPFSGAATVGVVANRHQRNYLGCELNPDYVAIAENRLRNEGGMFVDVVIEEKG
jgi:DNA modification methylase